MRWQVSITVAAEQDLQNIKEYIAAESGEERIAIEIMAKFYAKLRGLSRMPYSRRLYPDDGLESRGVRYIVLGSYVALFSINPDSNTVLVHRIVHHHQNAKTLDINSEG